MEVLELNTTNPNTTTATILIPKIISDHHIDTLKQELLDAVEHTATIVLDFTIVNFLSSTALSTFITANKRLRNKGGKLILANLPPEVKDLLILTNLIKIFEIQ